jgi:hypothetical protein
MNLKRIKLSPPAKKAQIVLTLIGLSGIFLSFVPFTYDQIPLDALFVDSVLSTLWALVAPCVILPIAVSIGYATWLIVGYLPRWLVTMNYALAVISACANLAGLGIEGPYETELIIMILLFVIAFANAAWLILQAVPSATEIRSLVAMQAVYVFPMAFWVAFAQRDFQIGAWLGVVALLAYLPQITMAVKRRRQVLAIFIPIVSIILLMTFTRQFW